MDAAAGRIPTAPPRIAPLANDVRRPLWSVMIPTYNCTDYLLETLHSVLAQDLGEEHMQITVVDDASTDADVAQLVAAVGGGRVGYIRQPVNVGSLRNFETCLNHATGEWVHLLHGDDRVVPGFYTRLTELARQHPEAGAVFSRYASIDEAGRRVHVPERLPDHGILRNWLVRLAEQQHIQYASIAVRRTVYEQLGGFYGAIYGEDWEMWVRIARYYSMAYTPEILAEYRGRHHSISADRISSGLYLADLTTIMDNIQSHLPAAEQARVKARSRKRVATAGIMAAYQLFRESNSWARAWQQLSRARAMSHHITIYGQLVKFFVKVLLRKYTGYH